MFYKEIVIEYIKTNKAKQTKTCLSTIGTYCLYVHRPISFIMLEDASLGIKDSCGWPSGNAVAIL